MRFVVEAPESWIRADGMGRILIGVRDGVVVARDPTTTSPCESMPRTVNLRLTDEPPVSTP